MATTLEIRQALVARGFIPIPGERKTPPFKKWQEIENVSAPDAGGVGKKLPACEQH